MTNRVIVVIGEAAAAGLQHLLQQEGVRAGRQVQDELGQAGQAVHVFHGCHPLQQPTLYQLLVVPAHRAQAGADGHTAQAGSCWVWLSVHMGGPPPPPVPDTCWCPSWRGRTAWNTITLDSSPPKSSIVYTLGSQE